MKLRDVGYVYQIHLQFLQIEILYFYALKYLE